MGQELEFDLTDTEQGELKLLVPTPAGDDPWGVLAPLRDTVWGQQIPEGNHTGPGGCHIHDD